MAKRSGDIIPSEPGTESGRDDEATTETGTEDVLGIASDEDDEFDDDDDDLEDADDEDSEDL